MGLVCALDVGIRVLDISGGRQEPLYWHDDTRMVAVNLLRNGIHYDLVQ